MFCAYTRPRYQVSVYRTIGPLLFFCFFSICKKKTNKTKYILLGGLFYEKYGNQV